MRSSICATVAALSLAGCAVLSEPSVPGMDREVFVVEPPKVSTILTALKCQLANAFEKIEKLRKNTKYANNPLAKKFKIKNGVGVFQGDTQIIQANTGTVSAVIPFTGVTGSTLGPDLGAALSGTSTENITRTFAITPKAKSTDVCDVGELADIDIGTFVEDRLVAEFETSVDLPTRLVEIKDEDKVKEEDKVKCEIDTEPVEKQGGEDNCKYEAYDPLFSDTSFKFKSSFIVASGFDGGVKATVLLSGPRVESFGPSVTADYDKSRTYTLTVTMNMGPQEATDPTTNIPLNSMRITFCDASGIGKDSAGPIKLLCVEEPYGVDRYRGLFDGLDAPPPYGISFEAANIALKNTLKQLLEKVPKDRWKKELKDKLGEKRDEALDKELGKLVDENKELFDQKLFNQKLRKAVTDVTAKRQNARREALKEALKKKLKESLEEAQEREQKKEKERKKEVEKARQESIASGFEMKVVPPIEPIELLMPEIELPEGLYLGPAPEPQGY